MDRFRAPPPSLPLRAWFFCVVLAFVLFMRGGASSDEALRFLVGLNPLGPDGQSAMHVLLKRSLMSFGLISFALAIGLSFALAAAMLVSRLGGRVSRFTGWLGSGISVVPPMSKTIGEAVGEMMAAQQGIQMKGAGAVPDAQVFTKIYTITYSLMGAGMISVGSIYPALMLWFLTRPRVKAACEPTRKPISGRDEL